MFDYLFVYNSFEKMSKKHSHMKHLTYIFNVILLLLMGFAAAYIAWKVNYNYNSTIRYSIAVGAFIFSFFYLIFYFIYHIVLFPAQHHHLHQHYASM